MLFLLWRGLIGVGVMVVVVSVVSLHLCLNFLGESSVQAVRFGVNRRRLLRIWSLQFDLDHSVSRIVLQFADAKAVDAWKYGIVGKNIAPAAARDWIYARCPACRPASCGWSHSGMLLPQCRPMC